jgi:hypothetical protein
MAVETNLPAHLIAYWTKGAGAAKINWGPPGDFNRCKLAIQEAVTSDGGTPLSDRVLSGLCSDLHVLATGERPGRRKNDNPGD